jgi:uncharacterized membrane protein
MTNLRRFSFAAVVIGLATSPSVSARDDTSTLQAFGDDPLWTVVIDASGMSMAVEEDGEPVFRELPVPLQSRAGKERVFAAKTENGTPVELRVAETPCAGSSEQLPMRATLSVGSIRREGCARVLDDMESAAPRPLLGDLAMDSRIVSKGGPQGYSLDIQEAGTTANIGGRVLNLYKPAAVQIGNAPWPTIAGNVATYALASDDETTTATATVEAASCRANGKTYLLTLTLIVEAQTYRSCASQAYQVLNGPMLSIPTVANSH